MLTPGLAPLARRERPTRLPEDDGRPGLPGRAAILARHASLAARRARSPARRERGWPSSCQARRLPAACKRVGHAARPPGKRAGLPSALLASGDGCGPRPLGRRRARRERSEPRRQHEPPKEARYDVVAPLPKRRREERSDDRVDPATWCSTVGSACRPPGLGFGRSSGHESLGRARARWRRSRSSGADPRRVAERAAASLAAHRARSPARRERGWPSSWQARRLRAACKRVGHAARPPGKRAGLPSALLASGDGCGPRPLGRRRARRERSEPRRQHEPPKEARYDVVAPLPKRRREERSDDRVDPATWCSTVGSACRPPGLGFGRSSGHESLGRARARWRRSRSSGADPRRVAERAAASLAAHRARSPARRERGWPSSWQARRLRAACKRVGHAARPPGKRAGLPSALLASGDGCGPRPLGRRRARRERSEPRRQHEPPKEARYDVVAPLPKRRREERSDDRVDPATWCSTVGSACRPPGLGFGRSSGHESLGRARARWRRSRSSGADPRRVAERAAASLAAHRARSPARRERGWPSSCQARRLPAACKRVGHAARPPGKRAGRPCALLASADGCGPRPLGRRRARRERSEPRRQHEPPKEARYDVVAPLPKRRREERSDDRVDPATRCPTVGSACRLVWSLVRLQLRAVSASAEREPDGGAAAHRALTRDPRPSAQPSRSPPSTGAARRRRLLARRARCQLDTGRGRTAPR